MSISKVYNAEIFTPNLGFRGAAQFSSNDFKYEYDYMDVTKNKLVLPECPAEVGDFIQIKMEGRKAVGMISDINYSEKGMNISFKPLHCIFDMDMYISFDASISIEEWLKGIIETQWKNNSDVLMNYPLEVIAESTTMAESYAFENGVNNFYEVVLAVFNEHRVVIDFEIDAQRKFIKVIIKRASDEVITIEADLDNITDKVVKIRSYKQTTNKVIIYSEDYTQSVTYYMEPSGAVTTMPAARVIPCVEKSVVISVKDPSQFDEKALAKANSTLKEAKYTNLIELECAIDDLLVLPLQREIGQQVNIIYGGEVFSSILTAFELNETIKLVFGTIRIELTKQIKKRWR